MDLKLGDISNYVESKSKKRFNVLLDDNYRRKLKKVKEHLNIAEDSNFLRAVIDLYYDHFINKS